MKWLVVEAALLAAAAFLEALALRAATVSLNEGQTKRLSLSLVAPER